MFFWSFRFAVFYLRVFRVPLRWTLKVSVFSRRGRAVRLEEQKFCRRPALTEHTTPRLTTAHISRAIFRASLQILHREQDLVYFSLLT